MPSGILEDFMGLQPKRDKRLLPPMASQFATNVKLWGGTLVPLRAPLAVFNVSKTGTIQSIYRMNDRAGGSDFWLHWPFDVDAVRGPVADTRQRLYYTGEYEPRVTTYEMAAIGTDTVDGADNYPGGFGNSGTDYPLAFYALGCHHPPCEGRVASVSGGVAASITRAYLYRNITAWGEPSAPSPVFEFTGAPDGTWNLELPDGAPLNVINIMHASHSGGTATVWTDEYHYLRAGHRMTIAGVVGMTELNGDHTVLTAVATRVRITHRSRATNVATLYLSRIDGFAVGQRITVANVGGTGYDGSNKTLTAIDPGQRTVSYADVAGDEAKTADTTGIVTLGEFTVALASGTAYTSDGTVTRQAPYNVTGMLRQIFRTVTGNLQTDFQLVAEIPISDTTYADAITDSLLGPVWVSTEGEDIPPGYLHSLTELANGMAAGAREEEVWFCVPYKYHAWKQQNTQPVNWAIVGLAGLGQRLAVMTQGHPYTMSGVVPEVMDVDFGEIPHPCVSKRAIQILDGFGVAYPSDRGLVVIGATEATLVTEQFFARDEWMDFANGGVWSASMVYDKRYYAFWDDAEGNAQSFVFNPIDPNSVMTQNNEALEEGWNDPETGKAYVVYLNDGTKAIGQWDAHPAVRRTMQWRSKRFHFQKPWNMGAIRLYAEFTITAEESAAIEAENALRAAANAVLIATAGSNGVGKRARLRGSMGSRAIGVVTGSTDKGSAALGDTILASLLAVQGQFVQIQVIADGVVRWTETFLAPGTATLPKGYREDEYEFNLVGNVEISALAYASNPRGLQRA